MAVVVYALFFAQTQISPYDVTVVAPAPPRSASQSVRDREALATAPHKSADDVLVVVPGLFVTHHGGEGKASQMFFRGFDAVHGQDVEVTAGGIPVNDVSNIHGQGYADLNFIPAELVQQIKAQPGAYDPRQGDFAVAGSLQLSLGYTEPGVTAKAAVGSFASQRQFLAYRPPEAEAGTFAAFEHYRTDGFGPARAAQRASFVTQSVWTLPHDLRLRVLGSSYAARFSSAGVLSLADVKSEAVDRFATYDDSQGGASSRSQALVELLQDTQGQHCGLTAYVVTRGMRLRQNFTGFLFDPSGDLQQQTNDAVTAGSHAFLRKRVHALAANDTIELGFFTRSDWITQSQSRLSSIDVRVSGDDVEAVVRATNVAAYLDAAVHPHPRVTWRGGLRLNALAFTAADRGGASANPSRSAQGIAVNPKATMDVRAWNDSHVVLSYGEGFRSPQARSLADGENTPFAKVRSGELGLRSHGTWGNASAAGFVTRLSEDLVFDPQTTRNEPVPPSQRLGMALDFTWQHFSWLAATASGTFAQARFTASDAQFGKGDLLPYVPQWVARADLLFKRQAIIGGHPLFMELGTGWSLLAGRPLPYQERGHSIFLVDSALRLRYRAVAAGLSAWNLLNSDWYDGEFAFAARWQQSGPTSVLPERFVTVGNPRTLLFDVSFFL